MRAAVVDGDTPWAERTRARSHANYLLTTPDMLHQSLLSGHSRWNGFFRRLRYVIVDECHTYRGVFGSHVAHVLRRLRRVAYHHSAAEPVFVLASATISEPARCGAQLTGRSVTAVSAEGAPRAPLTLALWEPPLTGARGEAGAPVRRAATTEAAELLADLVRHDVPALAFVRSRRGAESVAESARRQLAEAGAADLADRVAAYRSGYLPEERRALEEGAPHRNDHRPSRYDRAGTRRQRAGAGRGADGWLARHQGRALAAGRARRARRPRCRGRAYRP